MGAACMDEFGFLNEPDGGVGGFFDIFRQCARHDGKWREECDEQH